MFCRKAKACSFIKNDNPAQVFSHKSYKTFKSTYFVEQLWRAASGNSLKLKFQKVSRLSSTVVTMKPIGKAKIVNAIHRIETKKYAFTSKTALFRKNLTVFHLSSLWLCRGSHWSCSIKKVFLEISQNSQENTLRLASLLKKRLRHRCFLVNFSKYLRTPFLQISFRV